MHCRSGQISKYYDFTMFRLVILQLSWGLESPSTHLTPPRHMDYHNMTFHVYRGFQILSTFLTKTRGTSKITFPPHHFFPRAAERCTIQGWSSEIVQCFFCYRCFGFMQDLSMMFKWFQLLSSGARYLVVMVEFHRLERNQKLHWAPHKVETSLNYSEIWIII